MADIPFVNPSPSLLGSLTPPRPGPGPRPTPIGEGATDLGTSLFNIGAQRQVEAAARRRAGLTTGIIEANDEAFSSYSKARRTGRFNADALLEEYDTRLSRVSEEFSAGELEAPLFAQARASFSKMIESELTRRAASAASARLASNSIILAREYSDLLIDNPNLSDEEMEKAAGDISSRLGGSDLQELRLFDRMLGAARDAGARRNRDAAEAKALSIRIGVDVELDRLDAAVSAGDLDPNAALEAAERLRVELLNLPVNKNTAALRDQTRNYMIKLTSGISSSETKEVKREAALSYATDSTTVNIALDDMDNKAYATQDELTTDISAAASLINALPEDTPEQVKFKYEANKRVTERVIRFTKDTGKQFEDVKVTAIRTAVDTIVLNIKRGEITTEAQLEESINVLNLIASNGGMSNELKRMLSQENTRLKELFDTITNTSALQPIINEIELELKAMGSDVGAEAIANHINNSVSEIAAREGLTDSQTNRLRLKAFNQLQPALAEAADTTYHDLVSVYTDQVTNVYERASADVIQGEFDQEAFDAELEVLADGVEDDGIEQRVRIDTIIPLANKLAAQIQDRDTLNIQNQNEAIIKEKIEAAGLYVRRNPGSQQEQDKAIQNEIAVANLLPEAKVNMAVDASKLLLTQQVIGSVKRFLDNPDNRDKMQDFIAGLVKEKVYRGIDVESLANEAEFEWRREFNEQSKAIVDQRLLGIGTDSEADAIAMNKDPRVGPEDRLRYNRAYEAANEERLAAQDFQSALDTPGQIITTDDAGDYDAWWRVVNGAEVIREQPSLVTPHINHVGFMTETMVSDIWGTVLNGTTEEASGVLSTLTSLTPEVLRASLPAEVYEQLVFWKYDRGATSPEDSIVKLRSFHDGPQTAIREQLEREYSRLVIEEEFSSSGTIFDILDVEDAPEDSYGLSYANRDFLRQHRQFFLRGMDWGDSQKAAAELIRRDWGENIDGGVMYLPPASVGVSKLYNPEAREFDHSWIKEHIESTAFPGGRPPEIPRDTELRLFADETSRRRRNAGRSVDYLVRYKSDLGLIEFVMEQLPDGNERLLRYTPIPTSAMFKEQLELIDAENQGRRGPGPMRFSRRPVSIDEGP